MAGQFDILHLNWMRCYSFLGCPAEPHVAVQVHVTAGKIWACQIDMNSKSFIYSLFFLSWLVIASLLQFLAI